MKEVKYLVDQGINENRIEWVGFGGQMQRIEIPLTKNRRVEVVILSK